MAYLRKCNPPVYKYNREGLDRMGITVPEQTETLYRRLQAIDGSIPFELKDEYSAATLTPNKTKSTMKQSTLLPKGETPYGLSKLHALKDRMVSLCDFPLHQSSYYLIGNANTTI